MNLECQKIEKITQFINKLRENIQEGLKILDEIDQNVRFVKIKNYNYSISSLGEVRNDKTKKMLKPVGCKNGYLQVDLCNNEGRKTVYIHKLVAKAFIDNPENKPIIDHIDNDKTNNKVSNLRYATVKENSWNAKLSKKNTTGYKGVVFNKKANKYVSYICENGKNKHLGIFKTIEEAKAARQKKALELFGEFINECEK